MQYTRRASHRDRLYGHSISVVGRSPGINVSASGQASGIGKAMMSEGCIYLVAVTDLNKEYSACASGNLFLQVDSHPECSPVICALYYPHSQQRTPLPSTHHLCSAPSSQVSSPPHNMRISRNSRWHGKLKSWTCIIFGVCETRKINLYQAVLDTPGQYCYRSGEGIMFDRVFRCTIACTPYVHTSFAFTFESGCTEGFGRQCVFNGSLTQQGIAASASASHPWHTAIAGSSSSIISFDQLVSQAAKLHYRSGGHFSIGRLTVPSPTTAMGHD